MANLKSYGVVALLVVACGGDGTETSDPSTSTTTPDPTTGQQTSTSVPTTGDVDPTTGVVDPTTGDVDPTTGDGTTTTPDTDTEDTVDPSAATTGDVPVCGDGMVGGGEACDDGNKENTDACLDTCVPAACGDGFTQDGVEACDDGNDVETDGCLNTCAIASCGDGVTWDGVEACDDGNDVDDDACSNMCASASCGDGVVQGGLGEQCDDKNMVDTDGCLNTCKLPTCGDGVVWENMEDCDEGGANNDETGPCRTDCTLCECQGEDVMGQTCGDFGFSCGGLSCDGCNIDTAECASPSLPNFNGQPGPVFADSCWQQCEGYLDVLGGDDVPQQWGNDCAGAEFSRLRIVCGSGLNQYRYITVEKNVFKDGLIAYPENGLISEAKDQAGVNFAIDNVIYATGNHPHQQQSWWNGGQGCGEGNLNLTVNNICEREASNCFGQNIVGDRFLWVYVAP